MHTEIAIVTRKEVLGQELKVYGTFEEPLFLAADVAEWIEHSDTRKMTDTVDEEEKLIGTIFRSGQNREMWFLTEDGLYEVLMQSRKPIAREFKREVKRMLKEIRRQGIYATPAKIEEFLSDPDTLIKTLQVLKEERQKRLELESQQEADRPKVLFADSVSASKTSILIGDLAKILKQNGIDIGQKRLFHWLREKGWLIRQKGNSYNMPTQKGMEQGYFEIKETVITHSDGHVTISKTPKITGRGQVFFVHLFLSKQSQMAWISDSQVAMV
ncbi:MAG: phage antirepressor KilAC domain-containing protein [Planctomycetia bacterium]|nr:phage antirepressor KilAC domain-containing protein [Planctomycetia bacterium]